jgi:hypothetical protein
MDADRPRRHPDVFTGAEALEYLGLDPVANDNLLVTLRDKGVLTGWKPGKEYLYHRLELDAAVLNGFAYVFGTEKKRKQAQPQVGPRLRMAEGQ